MKMRTAPRARPFIPINLVTSSPINYDKPSLFSQIGFTCSSGTSTIRYPDRRLCNMYYTCTLSGLPEPSLCPDGYLFSELSYDCELASHVKCGTRLSAFFEVDDNNIDAMTTTSQSKLNIINGTIECILGADGYYEDPLYCNIYHHCIAGIDYVEHCPNQLAWNEERKMCDWYVVHLYIFIIYINLLLGPQMLTVQVKQCLLYKLKHRFAQIDKMAAMRQKSIATYFTIVLVVLIMWYSVLENYNGMIYEKNVDGNHLFAVVHQNKCYKMKIN